MGAILEVFNVVPSKVIRLRKLVACANIWRNTMRRALAIFAWLLLASMLVACATATPAPTPTRTGEGKTVQVIVIAQESLAAA